MQLRRAYLYTSSQNTSIQYVCSPLRVFTICSQSPFWVVTEFIRNFSPIGALFENHSSLQRLLNYTDSTLTSVGSEGLLLFDTWILGKSREPTLHDTTFLIKHSLGIMMQIHCIIMQ